MRTLRRLIACLLLVSYLPACISYKSTDLAPSDAVRGQETVRVTFVAEGGEEATINLTNASVSDDSLFGARCQKNSSRILSIPQCEPWSAPLTSVVRIETARASTAAIVVGAVLIAAAAGGAIYYFGFRAKDNPERECPPDEWCFF